MSQNNVIPHELSEKSLRLEQYKLYVEMADRVSIRRADTNKFYIPLLSGLFVIISITIEKNIFTNIQNFMLLMIAALGIVLCFVWVLNIRAYKKLNTVKFQLIQDVEKELELFDYYDREWKMLNEQGYTQLTRIEQYVPFLYVVPYIFLLIYSIYELIK